MYLHTTFPFLTSLCTKKERAPLRLLAKGPLDLVCFGSKLLAYSRGVLNRMFWPCIQVRGDVLLIPDRLQYMLWPGDIKGQTDFGGIRTVGPGHHDPHQRLRLLPDLG